MLEDLRGNKKLKYLNLSYNNLVSQAATPTESYTSNFGNTLETIAEEGGAGNQQAHTSTQSRLSNQ